MSKTPLADFVDQFFHDTLFQPDDQIANKALDDRLDSTAAIIINGNTLPAETFIGFIRGTFRQASTATVIDIQDLNIVHTSREGTPPSGTVAQFTKYTTKTKSKGLEVHASATTIVQVEVKEGKSIITGLWEVQTDDA